MSLMAFFEGVALAAKSPYISTVVGPLLQVLNMREARATYASSSGRILMGPSPGSKTIQRRVQNPDA